MGRKVGLDHFVITTNYFGVLSHKIVLIKLFKECCHYLEFTTLFLMIDQKIYLFLKRCNFIIILANLVGKYSKLKYFIKYILFSH